MPKTTDDLDVEVSDEPDGDLPQCCDNSGWYSDDPDVDADAEVTEDPETGRKGTRDVIKWVITCRLPAGG